MGMRWMCDLEKIKELEKRLEEIKEAADEYIEWADQNENHVETMIFREVLDK